VARMRFIAALSDGYGGWFVRARAGAIWRSLAKGERPYQTFRNRLVNRSLGTVERAFLSGSYDAVLQLCLEYMEVW
jgi:hypothetical protein